MQDIIRAGALQNYAGLLSDLGHEPEVALQSCNLNRQILDQPDHYVPYSNVICAIEYPASHLGIADFGMQLGAHQDLDFLGALSLAIQSTSTVRESFQIVGQYLRFHTPGAAISLGRGETPSEEMVSFQILLEGLPLMPQVSEHAISHILKVVALISAGSIQALRICFRHQQAGSQSSYLKYLGQVPEFESGFDGIVLDSNAVRRPRLQKSNPMLLDVTTHFLRGVSPNTHDSLVDRLKVVLRQLMRIRITTLQDASLALNLHPRSLQRGLRNEARTFESVRDEIRKELFLEYIQQGQLPLSHIAHMLGYSDQAVLTRSCARWFGKSPTAMRPNSVRP